MRTLEEKIGKLSPENQREVEDFVDFLTEKKVKVLKKNADF